MYVGGVYCPLNPTDPQERLVSILEQTHGQYVLVHEKTRRQFPSTTVQQVVSLDQVLCSSSYVEDINELPNYTECGAALIVCTFGATG